MRPERGAAGRFVHDRVARLGTRRAVGLAAAVLVLLGVVLRLAHYLSGRSVWIDEAALALNVFDRSEAELAQTLSFGQATPLGFLLAVEEVVSVAGRSAAALRFVPLVFGLAALPLLYVAARKITSASGALVALLLFAVAEGPIYYSAEFKQYSGDILAVVVLLAVALSRTELTWRRYLAVSVVAAGALWFSHASLFVIAAVATAYGVAFLLERRWRELALAAAASLVWLVSLAAFYLVSLRDAADLQRDIDYPARIGEGAGAWFHKFVGDLGEHVGLPASEALVPQLVRLLAAALAVLALLALLRRRPAAALMLGLPLLFLEIAVELQRYPLYGRTIVFLVPVVVLLLGHGIVVAVDRLPAAAAVASGAALVVLVSANAVAHSFERVADPRRTQEIRPLLSILHDRWRPGDTVYVHYAAVHAFRYYADCDCLDSASEAPPLSLSSRHREGLDLFSPSFASRPPQLIVGSHVQEPWSRILRELDALRGGGRAWVLSSHARGDAELHFLEATIPARLERNGRILSSFEGPGARLVLFDSPATG